MIHATLLALAVETQRIAGSRIAKIAQRIVAALPHDKSHAYVPVALVPDQLVAVGHVSLLAGSPIGTPTYVSVPVKVAVDGVVDRTVFVGYRVTTFELTAVAAHDLAPGSVLDASDLRMARVPSRGGLGNGVEALLGRKVYAPVLKGQPITIGMTSVNQIVKAGSTVVFIVHDNGVEIAADVIAQTAGGLGETVQVFNPQTHKALSGIVTAPGTVELDLSGGTR